MVLVNSCASLLQLHCLNCQIGSILVIKRHGWYYGFYLISYILWLYELLVISVWSSLRNLLASSRHVIITVELSALHQQAICTLNNFSDQTKWFCYIECLIKILIKWAWLEWYTQDSSSSFCTLWDQRRFFRFALASQMHYVRNNSTHANLKLHLKYVHEKRN